MKFRFLLLLLAFPLIFFSCKDDDDPAPNPVVGDWELDRVELRNLPSGFIEYQASYEPAVLAFPMEYKIRLDGTCTLKVYYYYVESYEGSWSFENNILKLDFDDLDSEEYTLEGEYLVRVRPDVTLSLPDPEQPDNEEAVVEVTCDAAFYLERDF